MTDEPTDILLVEDNPYDAELTLHALTQIQLAHHVELVQDGVAALEYIFGTGAFEGRNVWNRPRAVLLDLKLPRVDGLDVLRRIRGDTRTCTIPVVVLTSSREEHDVIESYKLGVNSYIVKPVDAEQFTTAVQQLGLYWLNFNQPPA
jgi:two-component system response regulator